MPVSAPGMWSVISRSNTIGRPRSVVIGYHQARQDRGLLDRHSAIDEALEGPSSSGDIGSSELIERDCKVRLTELVSELAPNDLSDWFERRV